MTLFEFETYYKFQKANNNTRDNQYAKVKGLFEFLNQFTTENSLFSLDSIFKRIDASGDHLVTFNEFGKGLKQFHTDVDDHELWKVFNAFDTDGSGEMNVDEFKAMVSKVSQDLDQSGGN